MPVHIVVQSKLAKVYALGDWTIQDPAPELVLGKIKSRHRPNQDIMQRHCDRSCDFVATANPRYSDRQ